MLDKDRDLKIGIWDLEPTGWEAEYDYILWSSIKKLGGGIRTLRIDDPKNPFGYKSDKWLIEEIVKHVNSFDLIVGWNTSGFDFPMLNSRAMINGIVPPERHYRRDLLFVARANGRLRNNKLITWAGALLGKSEKTFIKPKNKFAAIRGERWAINYYVEHNRIDVVETEGVYRILMPILGKKLKKDG